MGWKYLHKPFQQFDFCNTFADIGQLKWNQSFVCLRCKYCSLIPEMLLRGKCANYSFEQREAEIHECEYLEFENLRSDFLLFISNPLC